MLLKLAWRNVWRNKKRTFITMASIIFAVVLSVLLNSIKTGLLDKMKENLVSFYTGYAQIHKRGYWNEKTLENSFETSDILVKKIISNQEVREVVPRLESFALAASEHLTKGCMVVAIDPGSETQVTALDQKIIRGQYLNKEDRAVLLTEGLAEYLKLDVKDTLVLLGQGYHGVSAAGKFPVKGILRFGSPELNKGLVYMPLAAGQHFYGAENRLSAMVLLLDDVDKVQAVSSTLDKDVQPKYEVMSWQAMVPELDQVIQGENTETVVFLLVLYLLIAFGIFGTILMMTIEREYEFGIMVAIGMKKLKLSAMVIMENILISLLSVASGLALSVPVIFYLYHFPVSMSDKLAKVYENFGIEPVYYFSIKPIVFYSQAIVVLGIALVLSVYPMVKIGKLDPVNAMSY